MKENVGLAISFMVLAYAVGVSLVKERVMDWNQVQEFGRDWGWLSGPAVLGLWLLVGLLRWAFKPTPPAELTEPARSLVASLLDPADWEWEIHGKKNRVRKGVLIVDPCDGEILTLSPNGHGGKKRMGYLKEKEEVRDAAKQRLLSLQDKHQKLAVSKAMRGVS